MLAATPASDGTAIAQQREDVLDFCVATPEACAISVIHLGGGWEAHLNPDRPQPLASSMKILHLIAYAQAVKDGAIASGDTLTREQWAQLLTLDGGALASSWEHLGEPDAPSLEQLAEVMIRFSDNATPDWLLALLGNRRFAKARRKYVKGFMDAPLPISAMFGSWYGVLGEAGSGNRIAMDYSGIATDGYLDEVTRGAKRLQDETAAGEAQDGLCVAPPWATPSCMPPSPAPGEASLERLRRDFFTRSTTRTFARLYEGLLLRDRLPAETQEIVERHLEQWLDVFPTLSPAFRRYGLKGGSLASAAGTDVLTWAHYMETGGGSGVVVVVFLYDMLEHADPPDAADVNAFAQQMALDPAFAGSVRDALESDDERPELVPSILALKFRGGRKIVLKGRVDNASPNRARGRITVRVYVSDDEEVDGADTLLGTKKIRFPAGYKGKAFTVRGRVPGAAGKLLLLVVDPTEDYDEQDEANNAMWQRLR